MKKNILSTIMVSLLIGTFTACNTQESTQETSATQMITEQDNSQNEINQEVQSYVGTYEFIIPAEGEYGREETYNISLNEDGTFSVSIETYDSWRDEDALWKLYEATGTYTKEDNQWILLTGDRIMHNYRDAGESEELLSEEEGNTMYVAIKDDNTLLVYNGDWKVKGEKPNLDEMTEFTRVN